MDDVTMPEPVAKAESGLCRWLQQQGLLLPCPFDARLSEIDRPKRMKDLVRRLGYRYCNATLESYEVYHASQNAVLTRLGRFAESMPEYLKGGGGLLLFGDPGTGKDHLVASLLKLALVLHGLAVEWFDGGDLFDRIHAAMREDDGEAWRKLTAELTAPHILALSDPQPPQDALSPAQVRRLRDIIDKRYRAGKSTWITTNLDQKEYAERLLTKPVLDRLKESSAVILCDWPSYRAQKKASW